MNRVTDKYLLTRFRAFASEPWFEAVLDAFYVAWERDDEWGERSLLQSLVDTAHQRGIELPMAVCGSCKSGRPDILLDGEECARCAIDREDRNERELTERQARWNAMSEEERQRSRLTTTLMLHGLISRNVQ